MSVALNIENESLVAARGTSLWKDAWFRLCKNHGAILGLCVFCGIALVCLVGPFFTGYTYEQTQLSLKASAPLEPIFSRTESRADAEPKKDFISLTSLEGQFIDKSPSERSRIVKQIVGGSPFQDGKMSYQLASQRHLFGSDPLGRDLLTRVLVGGQISLAVGFAATLVSVLIGVVWGSIAGFAGGKTDDVMMRFADFLYALPFTVIVILLMVIFGKNFVLFRSYRLCRMAQYGTNCPQPGHFPQTSGIRRSSYLARFAEPPDFVPSSYSQCDELYYHLRNADGPKCHAARSVAQFPRTRSTAAPQFLGSTDRRGISDNADIALVAGLSRLFLFPDALFFEFLGRRSSRCARSQVEQGLTPRSPKTPGTPRTENRQPKTEN